MIDSVTLAAVVGGSVQGPAALFSGVAIDSRAAQPGDLFVPIRGPRFDGHDFLVEALKSAAGAFVAADVDRQALPKDRALIRVPDTLAALRAYARYVRETLRLQVVAVTGTVGKTTTKEMTAALLSQRYRVARSRGNLNNGIGLPAEVARFPEDTEVAVLEMGMSSRGEIKLLSELFPPNVAVVTAVTPVHMMSFGTLHDVMEAKAEILAGMPRGATFVANADDELSSAIGRRHHHGPVLRYGLSGEDLDATAREVRHEAGSTSFVLDLSGESRTTTLPLPGRHNLLNFLGAAAAASALGVTVDEIATAAFVLTPAKGRGELKRVAATDVLVYDDSYNSSPAALAASLAAFEVAAGTRRRVLVIGEMLELGRHSVELHGKSGRELARRFDVLITVRGDARALGEGAVRAGAPADAVRFVESAEAAADLLTSLVSPGDAVFVKGSRGVGLDRVVTAMGAA